MDTVFEAVVDRTELEFGALEGAEGALNLFEAFVERTTSAVGSVLAETHLELEVLYMR